MRQVKLGVLIPATNFVVEPDMYAMAPEGVTVHFERLEEGSIKADGLTAGNLADDHRIMEIHHEELSRDMMRAVQKLAIIKPAVIAFGCTSGSFFKGIDYDKGLIRNAEAKVGIPVTTTSTAAVEGLRELRLKKICVVSPYGEGTLKQLKGFLEANGFEVPAIGGMRRGPVEVGYVEPEAIRELAINTYHADCDGIFCACTGFRATEAINEVEERLGKPVVSANQATMWQMLRIAGVGKPFTGFGELMRHL